MTVPADDGIEFFGITAAAQRAASRRAAARYLIDVMGPSLPACGFGPLRAALGPLSRALDRGDEALSNAWLDLPILEKEELKADPGRFVLRQPNGAGPEPTAPTLPSFVFEERDAVDDEQAAIDFEWNPVLRFRSSGTSGRSIETWLTQRDLFRNYHRSAVFFQQVTSHGLGAPRTLKWINVIPAGPRLGGYGSVIRPILSGVACDHTFGGRVTPTPEALELISSGDYQVLMGITGYVVHLLREAQRASVGEGFSRIRRVVLVGEPVGAAHRDEIRRMLEALGAKEPTVLQGMSSTELKSAGFIECAEDSGMHIDPGLVFPEILDARTRQPVDDGEPGVLVWTHIDWRGTALCRYWTGDEIAGGMRWNPCPCCGLLSPRLHGRIGRGQTDSIKIKGTRTERSSLVAAAEAALTVGRLFQLAAIHENPDDPLSRDRLVLRIPASLGSESEGEVVRSVRAACGLLVDEIVILDEAVLSEMVFGRGQKAARFVDER